jgi:septum formation protein
MSLPPLILASGSPRRAELLGRLGLPFEVSPPRIDERPLAGEDPAGTARRLARDKAEAVAAERRQGLVLAADTVVALDGRIFGKPREAQEAREMIGLLSGREHRVITGVALLEVASGRRADGHALSSVRFARLSVSDLEWYLSTGEWGDKAGAYGLQGAGAWLVESVEGCPSNVIGLPPHLVRRLLAEVGWPLDRLLARAGG